MHFYKPLKALKKESITLKIHNNRYAFIIIKHSDSLYIYTHIVCIYVNSVKNKEKKKSKLHFDIFYLNTWVYNNHFYWSNKENDFEKKKKTDFWTKTYKLKLWILMI